MRRHGRTYRRTDRQKIHRTLLQDRSPVNICEEKCLKLKKNKKNPKETSYGSVHHTEGPLKQISENIFLSMK